MATGTVKVYNEFRGWGFITGEDGVDYFVHWRFIEGEGYKSLQVGERVEFEPVDTSQGPQAHNVTYLQKQRRAARQLKPNPFTPQEPVIDPNKFAGRGEPIKNAVDALFNNKNIIVSGERGIGKSSVAYQLAYLAQGERTLLNKLQVDTQGFQFSYLTGDHRCVPGNTLADILNCLAVSLHTQLSERCKDTKISTEWGIDLKLFKFSQKKETEPTRFMDLVSPFVNLIQDVFEKPPTDCNGMCFLIDEIDCLPPEIQLAPFFKATTESLRFKGYKNVSFLIAGVTGTMTSLIIQHPSFSRLFENIELRRMTEPELEEIIVNALRGTGVGIRDEVKKRIIALANRFPEPVQLLGYHTYRFDTNSLLEEDDLKYALDFIIKELKRQEFTSLYQRVGRLAEPIMRAMASTDKHEVSVEEIAKKIGSWQKTTAQKMGGLEESGILVKLGEGYYKLRDPLFKVYLRWVLGLG